MASVERIPVLDGIRGVAVLLVMMFHFWVVAYSGGTQRWEQVYDGLAGMGWVGVDLFFVLSGFLITGILFDSRESAHYFRVFYGRRTIRIFPLYYAALAIFFLIGPFVLSHIHRPVLADLQSSQNVKVFAWTYLLNWYEGYKGWSAVPHPLQHFWSLAVEEQFYLIWPLLILKLKRRRMMLVCVCLVTLAILLRAVMYGLNLPFASYTWTICRMDSLALGAFVALAVRDAGDQRHLLVWAKRLILPIAGVTILGRVLNPTCTVGPGDTPTFFMNTFELTLTGIMFAAWIALAIAFQKGSIGYNILASPVLRFFGKYSYCLYVCHLPVIVVFAKAGLNTANLVGKLHYQFLAVLAVNGIAFAISISIALLSWNAYEKWWLKLKKSQALQRENALVAETVVET